jgi:N-formylglutamate amidohydrolase
MPRKHWTLAALFLAALPAISAEPDHLVVAKSGQIPIILSAPHGGRTAIPGVPVRKGDGAADFKTVRDENTIELAELIAAEIENRLHGKPYLVMAKFERRFADANRSEEMGVESEAAKPYYRAYHRALADDTKEVQQKWKRGLLLDVHGQAAHPAALARGTNNGKTVELLLKRFGQDALTGPKSLFGAFEGMGYAIVPRSTSTDKEDRQFAGGYIVQTYGSHQGSGIDAIQLEFGNELRQKSKLKQTASAIGEAIEIFCRAYLPEAIGKDK